MDTQNQGIVIIKSITLSKKQKTKLLQMAKALFPEYNKKYSVKMFESLPIQNTKSYEEFEPQKPYWSISKDGHLLSQLYYRSYEDDWSYQLIDIHWFDFCVNHLTDRLGYQKAWLFEYEGGEIVKEHPVDFLYQKYKSK